MTEMPAGEPKPIDPRALSQPARSALGEAQQALARNDMVQAQEAYRRAQAAAPDDPSVPYVMAGMLRQAGQPMPALSLSLTAWRMAPQDPAARLALAGGFRGARFQQASPAVVQALLALFLAPDVSAQDLVSASLSLLRNNPTLTALVACKGEPAALARLLEDPAQRKAVDALFSEPLPRALLSRALIPDLELEALFTGLRRHLLSCLGSGTPLPLSAGNVAALALQADMGSFAWPQSQEEEDAVAALQPGDGWDDARLVRALYRRPPADEPQPSEPLSGSPDLAPVAVLHQRHYLETAHEARLASTLPRLGVAGEVLPLFPRWRSLSRQPGRPLAQVLAESLPLLPPEGWPAIEQPSVLVAGCGTGGTAVRAASRYGFSQVLALDGSLAALSYARRQAEAIGIGGITYAQASLESLSGVEPPTLPGAPFDIIECPSWLQFAADPAAGLAALAQLTAPQGFLRLGFYRHATQQALRAARGGLVGIDAKSDPATLRRARQTLIALPEEDPAKMIVRSLDFYDLAGLAGLLAQADATAFTLAQVQELLQSAGLAFLGFELPDRRAYQVFRQRHPDPAAAGDLSLWAAFEAEHPEVFLHAYQLWARPLSAGIALH